MKKLRLVKVLVQSTFVIDDGESLTEMTAETATVAAKDWPGYASGAFAEAVAAYEAKLNGGSD